MVEPLKPSRGGIGNILNINKNKLICFVKYKTIACFLVNFFALLIISQDIKNRTIFINGPAKDISVFCKVVAPELIET